MTKKISKIIGLWSSPRNISTALMYSFAQRKDTKVIDEPLYGYYLNNTRADEYHPSAKEIIKKMETDGEKVIRSLLELNQHEVYFVKNMAHHLLNLNLEFLSKIKNVILIRDPKEMIFSFSKVIPNPTMQDLGYENQAKLVEYMKERKIEYTVVDSKTLLLNPKSILKKLCAYLQINFEATMLNWESGPRLEDGIWAKHWYANVHNSNSFQKYKPKDITLPSHLTELYLKNLNIFSTLKKEAL